MNNSRYKIVPNIVLSDSLVQELKKINWANLQRTTTVGPKEHRKMYLSKFKLIDYFKFAKEYGWFFNKTGTISYYQLPADLEKKVFQQISNFFTEDLTGKIAIRLQVLYGNNGTVLHVDPTRTVSLIYPILHTQSADTWFFKRVDKKIVEESGMVNPSEYTFAEGLCINQPTLLDTKTVHTVSFGKSDFTKENPRVSLSVKWHTDSFDQVLTHLR